jgi:mono/diheme cytochrome c family protein
MRRVATLLALGAIVLAGAALSAEAQTASDPARGHALYVERCGGCHLEGGFGTRVLERRVPEGEAALEERGDLQPAFVMAVVRNGLGSMPQIREAELDDADLAAIAAYLGEGR